MKFKRMLKRKVYPTWVSIGRLKGCKAYVLFIPDKKFYHFQIDCYGDLVYISLTDDIKFNNFKECCKAAEIWVKENVIVY